MPSPIAIHDRHTLRKYILDYIELHGVHCDLNHIDVSSILYFGEVFANTPFDGDISKWNVSNALSTTHMFENCPFNGDISNWTLSSLRDARGMFKNSDFAGDLSNWILPDYCTTSELVSPSYMGALPRQENGISAFASYLNMMESFFNVVHYIKRGGLNPTVGILF